MTLESELETIRTNIVTNLTSKGVTASNTESLKFLFQYGLIIYTISETKTFIIY